MHIHMYIYIHIYIYIYIRRGLCIYIYIYLTPPTHSACATKVLTGDGKVKLGALGLCGAAREHPRRDDPELNPRLYGLSSTLINPQPSILNPQP